MTRGTFDFAIRLLLPTAMMAAALWYLGSLWNARQRDMNLILIQPVVLLMIPFYLAVILYEVRAYRQRTAGDTTVPAVPDPEPATAGWRGHVWEARHLLLMIVAAAAVPAYAYFGAVPATLALAFAGLLVLGVRSILLLVLVPVGTTLVLWLAFVAGMGIRIPLF